MQEKMSKYPKSQKLHPCARRYSTHGNWHQFWWESVQFWDCQPVRLINLGLDTLTAVSMFNIGFLKRWQPSVPWYFVIGPIHSKFGTHWLRRLLSAARAGAELIFNTSAFYPTFSLKSRLWKFRFGPEVRQFFQASANVCFSVSLKP